MDNNHDSKAQSNTPKITSDQNPPANSPAAAAVAGAGESNSVPAENNNDGRQIRTPFTDLSQVDADLALARTLQEQVLLCVYVCVYVGHYVKICSFLLVCVGLSVLGITQMGI